MQRQRGFTLIELLVVIAIIGILAAMLFPVFARARESARKIQCLSNVKNLALAVQMYLTDYDRFPPGMHQQDAIDFLDCSNMQVAAFADPYLRWPVIMDEYVKNRDIYRCPSAKSDTTPSHILPGYTDWVTELDQHGKCCICGGYWPSGWGGDVTDSILQGDSAGPGAPQMTIQFPERMAQDLSTSAISDPSHYVVVAEGGGGGYIGWWDHVENIAFPDSCRLIPGARDYDPDYGCVTCDDPPSCTVPTSEWKQFRSGDSKMWEQFTRHLGGNNLGFADGHAKWMTAGAILAAAGNGDDPHPGIDGVRCRCGW
jgi:prepilin-type N-terminal cleavage/methylation domain-containing protein/prepilin-type processing-associated H-X9-DG protein